MNKQRQTDMTFITSKTKKKDFHLEIFLNRLQDYLTTHPHLNVFRKRKKKEKHITKQNKTKQYVVVNFFSFTFKYQNVFVLMQVVNIVQQQMVIIPQQIILLIIKV